MPTFTLMELPTFKRVQNALRKGILPCLVRVPVPQVVLVLEVVTVLGVMEVKVIAEGVVVRVAAHEHFSFGPQSCH
tara:strand:+ start:284 stop:511 length:228 start_codon:yes stop_codon:yes gene_type:complete